MILLKKILEEIEPDYDLHSMYDDEISNTIYQFKSKKYRRQPWEVARFSDVSQVWSGFMKYGFVRDERKLDDIESILTRAFIKLCVNTMLLGHTPEDPDPYFKEYGIKTDKQKNKFYDWVEAVDSNGHIQWRISDYATKPLWDLVLELRRVKTAEEKLIICDKILHIVHWRSDLSSLFIEGGKSSLAKLSSIEGVKEFRERH